LTNPLSTKERFEATFTVPVTAVLVAFSFSVTTGVGAAVSVFWVRPPVICVEPASRYSNSAAVAENELLALNTLSETVWDWPLLSRAAKGVRSTR